ITSQPTKANPHAVKRRSSLLRSRQHHAPARTSRSCHALCGLLRVPHSGSRPGRNVLRVAHPAVPPPLQVRRAAPAPFSYAAARVCVLRLNRLSFPAFGGARSSPPQSQLNRFDQSANQPAISKLITPTRLSEPQLPVPNQG
ncbi:MAG: hypothetical protein AAFR36_30900, partial [Bacteroidota bacterium]